jgi:hypothetical protein
MTEPPAGTAEAKPQGWRAMAGSGATRLRLPAEDLVWVGLPLAALILAAAFAWLAPDLARLYPSPLHDEFRVWRIVIAPEPLEEARAIMALAAPFALAAIVLWLGSARPVRRSLDPLVVGVQVVAIGLLVWAVLEQPRTGPLLTADYFDHYFVSAPNLIAGLVIGVVLTIAILRPPQVRLPAGFARAWERLPNGAWLPLTIALLATVIWILPAVVTDSTLSSAGPLARGHIPVQGEDYFAAVNGRTPLVDYISQYANLLPLLLEPILKAVGPSITSYSVGMCVLSALGMIAIFGAFTETVRRPWAALLLYVPWVAFSLFPWNDVGPYREFNGIYYAVFPGRYFGPFVLAWLLAMSIRGRRIPVFVLFLFAGLVLLNNAEFGSAALLALVVALAMSWDRSLPRRRVLRDLIVRGAAGVIVAVALVSLVTLIRSGEPPNPKLLTYFNRLFLRDSYGLEPMSALGMHWVLYATYLAALLMATVRYVRRDPDRALTGMLAFSGVFGLATGMYFVGRSSQYQLMLLFPAWGFSLALVAWTAARSLWNSAGDRARLTRLLLPGCAALVGFGVMVAAIDRLPSPKSQIERLDAGGTAPDLVPVERLIESRARPNEHVLIIGAGPDHLVADRAGVVNVSPINGSTSLVSPAEANRSLDQLEDEGGDLVFDGVSGPRGGSFSFGIPEFAGILRERGFRMVAEDDALQLRVWRRG